MTNAQLIRDGERLSCVRERVIHTIQKLKEKDKLDDFQTNYMIRLQHRRMELERQLVQLVFKLFPSPTLH